MRITVGAPDVGRLLDGTEKEIAGIMTATMRQGTDETKMTLRDQVRSAGLGNRLANTWRGNAYPEGRTSLAPAGYLWSNAPAIVAAFDAGAQIHPLGGKKYLWIPSGNVPNTRLGSSRGAKKKAGPAEVEAVFNQDLTIFKGHRGHLLAFVDASATRSRGLRSAAKARGVKGKRQLVLMFTLVSSVRLLKRLDLAGVAAAWATRFPALLEANWR